MTKKMRATRLAAAILAVFACAPFNAADAYRDDLNHYILGCDGICPDLVNPGPIAAAGIDASFTGSWYDPAQSGQGLSIEVLANNRMLVLWFAFNPDGSQQSWLVGAGTINGYTATIAPVDMPTGGRWIPNFDPSKVVSNPWGTLTLTFTDANHGRVDFSSTLGFGAGSMNLTRLTQPFGQAGGIATPVAANYAWTPTGSLSTPRSGHSATLLRDGRVLIASAGSAELYDPAIRAWTTTADLPLQLTGAWATLLENGKVLVLGDKGATTPGPFGFTGSAALYDPATASWSPTGSLNTPRGAFTATLLDNGKVLVVGGVDTLDNTVACAELYDPATGTWSYTGNLNFGRFFHTATLLQDGRVLAVAGWTDDFFQTVTGTAEIYDPIAGTWSSAGGLHQGRVFHTATRLDDGRVLVAGGYDSYPPGGNGEYIPRSFSDAEVYDPSSGEWADVGSLGQARFQHSATLLPSGKVLVAGGFSYNPSQYLGSAELFDPASVSWTGAGVINPARTDHSATLLQNGDVLVAGGSVGVTTSSSVATASAEVYEAIPGAVAAGMTGTWYDPAQSGHGLVVEVLPGNQMLAEWFAFNPAGTQQAWFLGVGTYSGNTATIASVIQPTGGRWIQNFDPTKVVNNPWGTLTFTFTDCDHGKVDFNSINGYGSGSMNLTRLAQPAGLSCP